MTVLITGATGRVGGNVLAGLLERSVPVRAISRDPGSARLPAGVEVARADLGDPDTVRPVLDGVDRVFLYAGRYDPTPLMAVLAGADVERVVLLSGASASPGGAASDVNGGTHLGWMERTVAASGLTHTFLRPGTFAANAMPWRDTIRADGTVRLPYPESVQVPVHEKDVADVAVVALTTDRLDGAAPILTGPERITLREQVAAIGAAIGRELTVVEQTEAEAHEYFERFIPPRLFAPILAAWRDSVGAEPEISAEVEKTTGHPGRTFAEWAVDHADTFC